MKTDCNHCAPGIDCIHIGHGTGPQACPRYKRGDPTALPRGSVMELTITNCDAEGVIDARMCLRLVMHYTKEAGVIYENWASPDFPLPQPMISEILTFLEDHVCSPVSQDRYISRAEIPASLISKLLGPAWMSRFRALTTPAPAPAKQLTDDSYPAIIDVESESITTGTTGTTGTSI